MELKLADPFNDPQLVINNKDFKFLENNDTKIKTKWSSLTFDNNLTIPIGPRTLILIKKITLDGVLLTISKI